MSFERWLPNAILLAVAVAWLAIASGCSLSGNLAQGCNPDGTCKSANLECKVYGPGYRCELKAGK